MDQGGRMKRLPIVALLGAVAVVAGCTSGSSETSEAPTGTGSGGPASAGAAASATAVAEATESGSGSSASALPPLAVSELPRLSGSYSYLETAPDSDPVRPPKIPTQAEIRGFVIVPVAKGSAPGATASLEVLRFDAGLASSPVLDEVVTEEEQFMGNGKPGKASTVDGVAVRTVSNLQGMGITGVVFRRGADVVIVFSPEPAEARAVAAAYLAGS
jgi:hypothetical protein